MGSIAKPKVAFVTGGNGITGSALLKHLAHNTTREEWSDIIVTSRSPFETLVHDPRIKFIALDFSKDAETLAIEMRDICRPITHAYFSSYVHKDDFVELNSANQALFENFLEALIKAAPDLQSVALQTGGKYYNVHTRPVPSPAAEDDPRLVSSAENFYYPQEDFLTAKQKGSKWTWTVIRPEAIIGHTRKPNGMNSALTYALYFLVQKELGEKAPMPTNQNYWTGVDDCSDAALIADMTVWATTTAKAANQAFNVVNGDHIQWQYMWPRIAAYLGAEASSDVEFQKPPPKTGTTQQEFHFMDWAKDKQPVWDRLCEKAGVPESKASWYAGTWGFQDWVFQRTWCSTLSFNKAREFGYTGYRDSYKSITGAFDNFREFKQIP